MKQLVTNLNLSAKKFLSHKIPRDTLSLLNALYLLKKHLWPISCWDGMISHSFQKSPMAFRSHKSIYTSSELVELAESSKCFGKLINHLKPAPFKHCSPCGLEQNLQLFRRKTKKGHLLPLAPHEKK